MNDANKQFIDEGIATMNEIESLLNGALYQLETCITKDVDSCSGVSEEELKARLWAAHYMIQRAKSSHVPDNYEQVIAVAEAYDALAQAQEDLHGASLITAENYGAIGMDVFIEVIAEAAHEINRAYCQAIGDNSQPTWEDAPQWQQDSAINGVKFHIANPEADPAASHQSWLDQKIAEGWTYGPVKDADKKEHPCCVPYDSLPTEQKAKDYLFRATVHQMMAASN